VLTRRGYRVYTVGGLEEAIEYAASREEPIDLVFTDVVLPGISGPAMVTRMQGTHPDARVLFMSGYVDHSILPGGLIQPGTAFLQKPFTADALANKVRDVLDSPAHPTAYSRNIATIPNGLTPNVVPSLAGAGADVPHARAARVRRATTAGRRRRS